MNEIREIRNRTGLSQAMFCMTYDIPRRTLEEWEAGRRKPPSYVVELLKRVVSEDFRREPK